MELISAKEVFKKVDPDARYLFASSYGCVYWSECEPKKGTSISCPEQGKIGLWSYTNNIKEFQGKPCSACVIENPKVINKMIGKLCWFWGEYSDGNGSDEYIPYEFKRIGILKEYREGDSYPFSILGYGIAKDCKPIKKQELKGMIYNDK